MDLEHIAKSMEEIEKLITDGKVSDFLLIRNLIVRVNRFVEEIFEKPNLIFNTQEEAKATFSILKYTLILAKKLSYLITPTILRQAQTLVPKAVPYNDIQKVYAIGLVYMDEFNLKYYYPRYYKNPQDFASLESAKGREDACLGCKSLISELRYCSYHQEFLADPSHSTCFSITKKHE